MMLPYVMILSLSTSVSVSGAAISEPLAAKAMLSDCLDGGSILSCIAQQDISTVYCLFFSLHIQCVAHMLLIVLSSL